MWLQWLLLLWVKAFIWHFLFSSVVSIASVGSDSSSRVNTLSKCVRQLPIISNSLPSFGGKWLSLQSMGLLRGAVPVMRSGGFIPCRSILNIQGNHSNITAFIWESIKIIESQFRSEPKSSFCHNLQFHSFRAFHKSCDGS